MVKLAPFSAEVLQHFIHLERASTSVEPDGKGFEAIPLKRGEVAPGIMPTSFD